MLPNSSFHLLVVDDDSLIHDSIKLILPKHWRMTSVKAPQLPELKDAIHAAFVDQHLTGNLKISEGPGVIKAITQQQPLVEVVAMSGDLSIDLMEDCLDSGAKKFLAKPLMKDEVLSTLEKIEARWSLRQAEIRGHESEYRWIGNSKHSEEVKNTVASFKGEGGPILIEGDTGTGKEVVFRLLNQQELTRSSITVNIAGIPEALFESELFGHVRGAFTGADQMKVGLCEAAHGGDLFLDEIEALSLANQVKLLRFLETGEVRKVGGKDVFYSKARVITASNQNLKNLVKEGKFREDLLFRLNGKTIRLPQLKDRSEDIPALAKHFLAMSRPRNNKMFSDDGLSALKSYSWPGNVRELKRACEQLVLTSPLPIIRKEDVEKVLTLEKIDLSIGLAGLVENFEAGLIRSVLTSNSDIEKAAEILKISRSSLYKKIKDYNLEVPS